METPPRTATAAGGTHPSGMHSCFVYVKTPVLHPQANIELLIEFLNSFCIKNSSRVPATLCTQVSILVVLSLIETVRKTSRPYYYAT